MSLLPYRANAENNPSLVLPKAGLRIQDGELQRTNSSGAMLLRIPVTDVVAINLVWKFDFMVIVFLLISLGLSAIAYYVSENNILSCILYVVAVLGMGLTFFCVFSYRLVIETMDGTIDMPISDERDEAESFVVGVRRMLRRSAGRAGTDTEPDTGFQERH